MPEVFFVDGARTPVGRYGGALSSVRPNDLTALAPSAYSMPETAEEFAHKVLDRGGTPISDLAAVELKEPFASQARTTTRELKLDPDTVNNDGCPARGAALGRKLALATMHAGVGRGTTLLVDGF